MQFEIDGRKFHYEVTGQGIPLLLLHGWGCNTTTVASIAAGIQDLRTVYSVDFPGFGESPEPPEPWSVTEYTQNLLSFMQLAGIERADVIGHSFGGRVALLLAATHPERVGKIVITGGAGLKPKRGMKYYTRVYLYKLGKFMLRHGWMVKLAALFGVDLKKRAASAGSEDYRNLSDGMKKTFVRVVNQDLRPCLKSIRSSTLLIWGEHDGETPLWMGQTMEREIADAGIVVFEGAGHYAFLDQNARFIRVVRAFLGGKG